MRTTDAKIDLLNAGPPKPNCAGTKANEQPSCHACLHGPIALHFQAMQPLKAHVHNGRLVLDEPTDLPEGEVIELVHLDEMLSDGADGLDDQEREQLHESLRESIRQLKAG